MAENSDERIGQRGLTPVRSEDIAQRIICAFESAKAPPSVVPKNDRHYDQLVGRRWEDFDANEIYLVSDALYTFTPEGFQYFLPAFILPVLTDPTGNYELEDEIVASLTRIQEHPARLSILSEAQRTAVALFVEWCTIYHPELFMQDSVFRKLQVCQIWNPYLPAQRSMLRSESEAEFFSEPAAALREAFQRTFRDTSFPSGLISADQQTDAYFRSMESKSWDAALLFNHQEPPDSFTDEGHRRFLPCYMTRCLNDYPAFADLVRVLMEELSPWPTGVGTPFQDAEREVVARFVRWALAHRPEPFTGHLSDKRELCAFWSQYLPPGMRMDFLDPGRD